MDKNELLRRSLEMGSSFLDMTRERAEVLVKELVDEGVVRKGQAEKSIDLLVERSRKRSEALGNLIRREVAEQLSAFGVATKGDIARLESKLEGGAGGATTPTSAVKSPARGAKAAAITKSAKTAGAPTTSGEPTAPPAMSPDDGAPKKGNGAPGTPPMSPEAR